VSFFIIKKSDCSYNLLIRGEAMKTFLFEQYGYYPKNLDNNTFIIDGWIFKLISTEISNENLVAIENYTNVINDNFNKIGPYIIKNKLNNNLSMLKDINYVLISCLKKNMNLIDLKKFHALFYNEEEYVELDKILDAWKSRVEKIENNLSKNLRVDSLNYKYNLDIAMFSIGLAINAMQYLSDIIYNYGKELHGVTIVHKRLVNLDSFDFFNPFNFIVEHPLKDIVLLYQSNYLCFEEFKNSLLNYKLDIISATFTMSRLLYRVDVFDFLETKRDLESFRYS
jgi:hypothetical protein